MKVLIFTLLLVNFVVNMMDHAKVSMKDFELLKVLGTGGKSLVTLQHVISTQIDSYSQHQKSLSAAVPC